MSDLFDGNIDGTHNEGDSSSALHVSRTELNEVLCINFFRKHEREWNAYWKWLLGARVWCWPGVSVKYDC